MELRGIVRDLISARLGDEMMCSKLRSLCFPLLLPLCFLSLSLCSLCLSPHPLVDSLSQSLLPSYTGFICLRGPDPLQTPLPICHAPPPILEIANGIFHSVQGREVGGGEEAESSSMFSREQELSQALRRRLGTGKSRRHGVLRGSALILTR